MGVGFERRAQAHGEVPAQLPWPIRLTRQEAWMLLLTALSLISIVDVYTSDLWFGPAYLLIIAGAAWCLGWQVAIIFGFVCLAIGLGTNGLALYPYAGIAVVWNMAMRFLLVLTAVAVAASIRRAYEAEWRFARSDQLTNALNRKGFFELTFGIRRSQGWTLLVYADLDGLKKLNDLHGHRAGDEVLRLYSHQVLQMIRKDDKFARLGGDEFAIYMQVRDETAAKLTAARLHSGMNAVPSTKGAIRCSLGALIIAPGARAIDTELCSVDQLMYEAKAIGASLVAATAVHKAGELRIIARHTELIPPPSGGPLGLASGSDLTQEGRRALEPASVKAGVRKWAAPHAAAATLPA
jgi:diguanylate cyclase (GGDEF)-like protein